MTGERTRILEAKGLKLSMPGVRVVVIRGPDRRRSCSIEREEIVIGCATSADLQLTDPTVSRNHLSVRVMPDGYLATDLDSTNGTKLNGRRVRSAYIEIGDALDIGATRVRLESVRRRVELPLSESERFGPLIGRSVAARRMFALLSRIAGEDLTVLLTGETGTGKDTVAEALHEAGRRARGPFVPFDCAAVVGTLLESELFGHEEGAFTGASRRRTGALRDADGGTLFLDEIGEMPKDLQPKLLRAIERKEARPLGSSHTYKTDARIIAATNRDLKLDVNRGLFREDLFYRLNVVSVHVPPLRERPEDIPLLADHFWRAFTGDEGSSFPKDSLPAFLAYGWPGNIRELRNRVERMAVLQQSEEITGIKAAAATTSYREAKARMVDDFDRQFLSDLMRRARGNTSEAARMASMDRGYLTKLLRKHGLHQIDWRSASE